MFSSSISDVMARIMALYFVQFIMGIIVGVTFYYFSRVYKRKFLHSWSWSWFAFSAYMLGMFLVTEQMARQVSGRLPFTILSQLGAFFHVLYLLMGTYELIKKKSIPIRTQLLLMGIVILFAFVSVWLFHYDLTAMNYRYALRYGMRTLFSGLGFAIAGFIVWTNPTFMRGLGQKMLAIFFIGYSIDQLYYFSIVVMNIIGIQQGVPSFFGLVDLMLISFIAMTMIMWLLEDEREKLRITNNELDSFLYSTSHDLRAPLASILGITNISKYEVTDEKAKNLFAMIEERAKKLDSVIADILNLARSKKKDLKTEKIDFNKLLQDIASDVKFTRGAQQIRLDYDENVINSFYSDANQLKIILGNLLSNAVKYHNVLQPDPFIKVGFKKDEKRTIITVQDNGSRIPTGSQSRIFEMFYRASLNTEGTGLGLYITKEAVVKLAGEISFVSEEGKGTTFTIVLANPKVYN